MLVSVLTGIVLAAVCIVFLPNVPVLGSIAYYALAVALAGLTQRVLRRWLRYDASKASMRYLRSDATAPPSAPADASSTSSN